EARQEADVPRRDELGLARPPVSDHKRIGPAVRAERALVRSGDRFVLAVREAKRADACELAEQIEKRGVVEAGHAMRRAGEDLEERDTGRPERRDLRDAVGPSVRGEAEIDERAAAQVRDLLA